MVKYNPSLHPRDSKGRWTSKGKLTGRVSLRSATLQYGRTFPLIPGKVNIYVGALARVEKAGDRQSFLEKKVSAGIDKLVDRIPQNKVGKFASGLLRDKQASVGGLSVNRQGARRRAPQLRVSSARASTHGRKVRQPRAPRQARRRPVGG